MMNGKRSKPATRGKISDSKPPTNDLYDMFQVFIKGMTVGVKGLSIK